MSIEMAFMDLLLKLRINTVIKEIALRWTDKKNFKELKLWTTEKMRIFNFSYLKGKLVS